MKQIISVMRNSAALTRPQIWYPGPPYIPRVRTEFSLLARAGFVGARWKPGGSALIGSNGNSTEERSGAGREYEASDSEHAKLIRAFRDTPDATTFRNLMDFEENDIRGWRTLHSYIEKVLERLDVKMEEVAILNVIPFSTVDAPALSSPTWKNSLVLHLAPLLRALQPDRVIWLGKKALDGVRPHTNLLPRAKFHTVSRQRSLNWQERLQGIPDCRQ